MRATNLFAILSVAAGIATASPIVNVLFDPGVAFTAADKSQIQSAIDFYTSNLTDSFTLTIAFGSQAGGGGGSQWLTADENYNAYYNALIAHSSANAADASAIASLGGGTHTNNPVTGSGQVEMTLTLASLLGLESQQSDTFAACGGLTANACITLGTNVLFGGPGGSPNAGLFGVVQHETDEVLGTASNLPNGGGALPGSPFTTDLFRYSAPGVRSFALNTSTDVPCTGAPTAFFSINGGATNLSSYNNCDNGGDYGDWIGTDGLLVQDAFGPDDQAASLSLNSPEVTLLDATGYNFSASVSIPEPSSVVLLLMGLLGIPLLRRHFV